MFHETRQIAQSPLLGLRNGFANRVIFRTPGAISFTLPLFADKCKIAVFGAGGGGALHFFSGAGTHYPAGGGAGGGFTQKILSGVSGLILTGTVGTGGLGGQQTGPGSNSTYLKAGSNGTTSTATLSTTTLSATGGAGAPIPQTAAQPGAAGGVGSGGDINYPGGAGGTCTKSGGNSTIPNMGAGGGGASGSPQGPGGKGGNSTYSNSSTLNAYSAGGGGWGGAGADATEITNSTAYNAFNMGGGTQGPGPKLFLATSTQPLWLPGGRGGAKLIPAPYLTPSSTIPYQVFMGAHDPWWDLEDVNGWGGGFIPSQMTQILNRRAHSTNYVSMYTVDGGPGGGGSFCGINNNFGSSGGFGGGGAGSVNGQTLDFNTGQATLADLVNPSPGGIGGGGGGYNMYAANGASEIRASDGGDGCVILWF